MKILLPLSLASILLGAASLSSQEEDPPRPGQAAVDQRLEALETEVALLRADRERMDQELAEIQAYLSAQAAESGKVIEGLAASEEAGFTAGINYRSREILLGAMRSYWKSAQKGVPGAPAKPDAKKDG